MTPEMKRLLKKLNESLAHRQGGVQITPGTPLAAAAENLITFGEVTVSDQSPCGYTIRWESEED